jgi:type 1 fimbria pilin
MNNMIKMLNLLAMLTVLYSSVSQAAQEQCRSNSQLIVQVHDVNFLPGAGDGTPISAQMPVSDNQVFSCSKQNEADTSWNYKEIGFQINAKPSGLTTTIFSGVSTPIYQMEGTQGLGFALGFREPEYCSGDYRATEASNKQRSLCSTNDNPDMKSATGFRMQPYVVFFKIPSSGSPLHDGNQPATVGQMLVGSASMRVGDNADNAREVEGAPQIYLSSLTVKYGSCAVTSGDSSIQVDMGKVSRSEFKGVGSYAGETKNFRIHLLCENNASVRVGFFGNATASDPDALALTRQEGSASGVGIALMYGGNLQVPAGQRVPLNAQPDSLPVVAQATSTGLAVDMEFQARYIQTDSGVSAGRADSMATFNIIYN